MKTIKYIVLGVLLFTLVISSFTFMPQKQPLMFSETYTSEEVLALLKPSDDFFLMIDTSELQPSSSKFGNFSQSETEKIGEYIQRAVFRDKLPGDLHFAWGVMEKDQGYGLFALKDAKSNYHGPGRADINKVAVRKNEPGDGFGLYLSFADKGAEKWADMTRRNVGRNIAILVNGTVYAAPRVMEEMRTGECMISGNFTESEINQLKMALE